MHKTVGDRPGWVAALMNRNNEENVIARTHEHTQQLFNNPIKLFLLFFIAVQNIFRAGDNKNIAKSRKM